MAEKFSFEMTQVSHQTFGFHGLFNLPSIMQQDLQILFDNLQPKTAIRFFRAFRDACEALPPPSRELFYNYCKKAFKRINTSSPDCCKSTFSLILNLLESCCYTADRNATMTEDKALINSLDLR